MTFDGGVGGALVPNKLAARASLLFQHRDDWIDNAFTKKKDALGGFDERAARLQVLFTPTDKLSVLFNVHAATWTARPRVPRQHPDQGLATSSTATTTARRSITTPAATTRRSTTAMGQSAKIDYDFGGATLTSITAYETTHGSSRGDIDGGNPAGPGFIPFQSESTDGIKTWTSTPRKSAWPATPTVR
jgi:iron complex outermembrane receptor protein